MYIFLNTHNLSVSLEPTSFRSLAAPKTIVPQNTKTGYNLF